MARPRTAEPPYVAVIFTSQRALSHESPRRPDDGTSRNGPAAPIGEAEYARTADEMEALAAQQPGYLGIDAARDPSGFGITVSYWATEADARVWKRVAEHAEAQRRGRDEWYERYEVRVATVTRAYSHP
jgi:heme-degrading monooxygenase HmoA